MILKMNDQTFESELISLLNRYSLENGSNTPDFILARYLIDCLEAYNNALCRRSRWWHGNGPRIIEESKPFDDHSELY